MIRLNIQEAKMHLSKYLDHLAQGETIILCKRNTPIAEIRALPPARKTRRPIGLAKGELKIPKRLLDPLPEDVLDAFDGKP